MAEETKDQNWEVEQIPDLDRLFLRVHKNWLWENGDLNPGFFRNTPPDQGLSCDWEKYTTPTETRNRAKDPPSNGVLAAIASAIRAVPRQRVEHDPDPQRKNRAHSQIFGEKSPEVRIKLLRSCTWLIEISPRT